MKSDTRILETYTRDTMDLYTMTYYMTYEGQREVTLLLYTMTYYMTYEGQREVRLLLFISKTFNHTKGLHIAGL